MRCPELLRDMPSAYTPSRKESTVTLTFEADSATAPPNSTRYATIFSQSSTTGHFQPPSRSCFSNPFHSSARAVSAERDARNLLQRWVHLLSCGRQTCVYSAMSSSSSGRGALAASCSCCSYCACCTVSMTTSGGFNATCSTKCRFGSLHPHQATQFRPSSELAPFWR